MQDEFFSKVTNKKKYEIWSKFSFEKMQESIQKLHKNRENKKDIQIKHLEQEVMRLQAGSTAQ
jgi:ribosome recycling factor